MQAADLCGGRSVLELPVVLHDLLSERLDEYLSGLSGSPDPALVATAIVSNIEGVAEDLVEDIDDELAEGLVARLESSGELDGSLAEVLEEVFETDDDFDYSAEEVVSLIERLCEVEWTHPDEDEEVVVGLVGSSLVEDDI
jgi:hypothetical protein